MESDAMVGGQCENVQVFVVSVCESAYACLSCVKYIQMKSNGPIKASRLIEIKPKLLYCLVI